MRGEGIGVAGSQPMSTAVHRSPKKLWRSNVIFNLWGPALQNEGERVEQLHLWVRLRGRRLCEEPAAPEDFQRGGGFNHFSHLKGRGIEGQSITCAVLQLPFI